MAPDSTGSSNFRHENRMACYGVMALFAVTNTIVFTLVQYQNLQTVKTEGTQFYHPIF